jgi:nitroimidazol reductase NimA-like FMN-containing flavoprotein (pyridoxamine 5'-phosphate oxidase superfamily)
MPDLAEIDRVLAANRYLVLATADLEGTPWATPVFFAPLEADRLCWVSSPDSRHSRNIAARPAIAITVFDSTVPVGGAEAAYFDAEASLVPLAEHEQALRALNARVSAAKQLSPGDLQPDGRLGLYQAELRRRYVLVRGGDAAFRNVVDMTFEV